LTKLSKKQWFIICSPMIVALLSIGVAHADISVDDLTSQTQQCFKNTGGVNFDHTYCWAQGIYYMMVGIHAQNDKLIQLQEQQNKLLAYNVCSQQFLPEIYQLDTTPTKLDGKEIYVHSFWSCVKTVLNDTK
jgi:hypothetical protein